jgi:hypothetical protein
MMVDETPVAVLVGRSRRTLTGCLAYRLHAETDEHHGDEELEQVGCTGGHARADHE